MLLDQITAEKLAKITEEKLGDNLRSVLAGLEWGGKREGLGKPHRLAQYLAQLEHESMGFHYDREIWGPTPAQQRYEGRKDLGNTKSGDGSKFRGRGPIQITGRYNTTQFWEWCTKRFDAVPNFVENPDLINTDPWEGIGPIWYWSSRNLNRYADIGDIEMVTRKINGGLNGYSDRCRRYTEIALKMLGYGSGDVSQFQKDHALVPDGIAGPRTRETLHIELTELDDVTFGVEPARPDEPFAYPEDEIDPFTSWFDAIVSYIKGLFK